MKRSLYRRIRRAVKNEFRRIRDEHRHTGRRRHHKPPADVRLRHWFRRLRERGFRPSFPRRSRPRGPSLAKRAAYRMKRSREKYSLVFSKRYLVITLNSTALYLLSFFLIHFLTHAMTGFSSWLVDIRTTLNYTFVDWHIRWWNWTEEMVITVFSIPAIFALVIAILCWLPFARKIRFREIFRRMRYFTRKQRRRYRKMQRQRQLELQVRRMNQPAAEPATKRRRGKRLAWSVRLFLLWTLYHSLTYFFSGLLYAFLFHRRLGYVVWYLFNNFFFDALFSAIAFLSMVTIGFVFARQFFHSAKMYLNNLDDRNRMPFVLSQAIFPFILGMIITTVMMAPDFDLSLILLNFSVFFLLLPLPSRALRFDNLHFDSRERPVRILWGWIIWSFIIVTAIYVVIKIGIPISFG